MSPHDMEPYRGAFDTACHAFGWTVHTEMESHERDAAKSWEVDVWRDANGTYLFREEDLSEGLVKELIRLATLGAV